MAVECIENKANLHRKMFLRTEYYKFVYFLAKYVKPTCWLLLPSHHPLCRMHLYFSCFRAASIGTRLHGFSGFFSVMGLTWHVVSSVSYLLWQLLWCLPPISTPRKFSKKGSWRKGRLRAPHGSKNLCYVTRHFLFFPYVPMSLFIRPWRHFLQFL